MAKVFRAGLPKDKVLTCRCLSRSFRGSVSVGLAWKAGIAGEVINMPAALSAKL